MKKLIFTVKFKRDVKKYIHQPQKIEKMRKVVDLILSGEPVPEQLRLHPLRHPLTTFLS